MTKERVITTEGGVEARITLTDPNDPESLIDKVFDKVVLESRRKDFDESFKE